MKGRVVATLAVLATWQSGGCATPPRSGSSEASGLDPAWSAVTAGSLSERITDPMLSVHHDQFPSRHFRVTRVVYEIDGLLLFAQRLDRTRPPPRDMPIFDGRIRPGRHVLIVYLVLERLDGDRLSAEPASRVTLRTTQVFMLGEGQFAAITAQARETDGAASPTLDFEIRFQPVRLD